MPPLLISAFCFLNFSFVFELVAEAGRERDAGFFEQIEHAIVKSRCFLPDGEFFELGIFGHAVFLLSSGLGWLLAIGYWLLLTVVMPTLIRPSGFPWDAKTRTGRPHRSKAGPFGGANDTR